MRYSIILIINFLVLSSCEVETGDLNSDSVELLEGIQALNHQVSCSIGETVDVEIIYRSINSCVSFAGYDVTDNDSVFLISVYQKKIGIHCRQVISEEHQIIKLNFNSPGIKTLKINSRNNLLVSKITIMEN